MDILSSTVHRLYISALLLLGILPSSPGRTGGKGVLIYVGTYTGKGSEGIYAYQFDQVTGKIQPKGLAVKTENPSFLAADPKGQFLYAVNEVDNFGGQQTGAVSVFSVEPESGKLKLLQQVSSLGSGPAHLSLDRSGRYVLVANYGGGNVAVLPIGPGGLLGNETAFMQAHGSSVNKSRQSAPHAHFIHTTPDNRLALVADLGIDKILPYDFDERTGGLTLDSARVRSLAPGAGPRHIAMVPSGAHLYVANEMFSSVTHFASGVDGMLEMKESVSTLPEGFSGQNTAAEILVDEKGRFVYVSNRGDDSIVLFGVDAGDGSLRMIERVPSGGRGPRSIALDPSGRWLFSANQNSNLVALFKVDPGSGRLTPANTSVKVTSPVCVIFVAALAAH